MTRKVEGGFPVRFRYTPGIGNMAFLESLRDRGAFLGSRCDACSVTYVPARAFCERCFAELSADTEVGPDGTLESFTVGSMDVDGEPTTEPIALGLVKLDGADTVLLHRLLDATAAAIGMRVRPVLRSERTASILDVEGFRLV